MKTWMSVICLLSISFYQESSLKGRWKIVSYEAIDKIKASPAYLYASDDEKQMMNQQFRAILEDGYYDFGNDTLFYSDIEYGSIVKRIALYDMTGDILEIKELDRPFVRSAIIQYISSDSLVLKPIIKNVIGNSNLIFIREDQSRQYSN